MKPENTNSLSIPLSMSKNSLLLFLFALLTAGVLATTFEGTKEAIALAERKAAEKALLEIIPANRIDNDLLLDTINVPTSAWSELGLKNGGNIHIARKDKQIIAVIIPAVAPDGYSGDIKMIAGINSNGTIAGVRVLTHTETPGLGDKVDLKKSNWINSFNHKSLEQPSISQWKVKKDGGDFDQFTGATITPRAVVRQIRKVLEFVKREQTHLFTTAATAQTSDNISLKNSNE